MKNFYYIIFTLLLSALVSSCQRRPLEDEMGDTAFIPIHIDWSQSGLDVSTMHNASLWFFPQDGRRPVAEVIEVTGRNFTDAEVMLPEGVYSVIVFNGYVDEDGSPLAFSGTDRFDTFAVSTIVDESRFAKFCTSRADNEGQPVRRTPDALASWSLNQFEVTWDMVVLTRTRASRGTRASSYELTRAQEAEVDKAMEALRRITPLPLTHNVTVEAYVHRLTSASLAGGRLVGATGKMLLSTRQPVYEEVVSHPFEFDMKDGKDVIWDDPVAPAPGEKPVVVNGTLHKTFCIFHHQIDPDYELDLSFTLTDGKEHTTPKMEVTEQVNKNEVEIKVEVGSKDPDPKPEDPEVPEVPETDKPIVLPVPQSNDVGVGDWETSEDIIIK